jgi:hypothetical protein
MNKFQELKEAIEQAENDARKTFNKKNVAASTRLRKSMQLVKSLANEVRVECLEIRK